MVQMKPFHYLYVIIGMLVAAFFGISLDMGITCMIPVSFVVIGLFAYQNMKKIFLSDRLSSTEVFHH